ncbi:hypothetical protein ACRALDRAFT_1080600 [Sodiomyces alcalophilus JCM 7366]|uniref:uncharacterized protein n=1 Tax=Sodiomyces alcalophilus JCM 7366 TaxID=591952 RepID=UPI0039B5CEBD
MCGGENVYYTACGCWMGHVILYTCPRGEALGGSHCWELDLAGVHRVEGYCVTCKRKAEQMKRVGMEYSLGVEDRDEAAARHGKAYISELIRQEKEKAGEPPGPSEASKTKKKKQWRVYYVDPEQEGQSSSGIASSSSSREQGREVGNLLRGRRSVWSVCGELSSQTGFHIPMVMDDYT